MTQIDIDDLFLGTWQLQPQQSAYEFGPSPAEGLYRISTDGQQYLFELEWKTAEGQQFETSFSGVPDGRQYPYENPQIADALSLTRVDEQTLDSASYKGGKRIAHARRELLDNSRTMRVTQSGQTPDGVTYSNVSYYNKLD